MTASVYCPPPSHGRVYPQLNLAAPFVSSGLARYSQAECFRGGPAFQGL